MGVGGRSDPNRRAVVSCLSLRRCPLWGEEPSPRGFGTPIPFPHWHSSRYFRRFSFRDTVVRCPFPGAFHGPSLVAEGRVQTERTSGRYR